MANSVDPDQTPHLRRPIWVCTVCSDLSVQWPSVNTVQGIIEYKAVSIQMLFFFINSFSCSFDLVFRETDISQQCRPRLDAA